MDRVLGGLHATDIIMTGLRGVGKTVLLNHLVTLAKARGMETIKFEVPDARGGHLTPAMVIALGAVLKRLDRLKKAGEGPLGHPRVWLTIPPEKGHVDCPYCDRRFVLKAAG